MKLINNRYRILECIDSDLNYSKYIVNDLMKRNEIVFLYLVNASDVTKPIIDYCTENFYNISPMKHPNILSIYSFGLVDYIDEKPCNDIKYFYTTEYFENNLMNSVKKVFNNDEIINIYIQISRAISFLHFHGIIYKYLGTYTIITESLEYGCNVKLLDLVSLKFKVLYKQFDNNLTLSFMAPEILQDGVIGEHTDVYSLGIILYYLKTLEHFKPSKLSKRIEACINDNLKWDLNFYKLIYNMTQSEYPKRIQSINEVNVKVKQLFSFNEKIPDKTYIDKLNFKTAIVGRDLEIKKVISSLYNHVNDKKNISIIVISGIKGIGKTRLLNEVLYRMQLKRTKCILVSASEQEATFYKVVPKILKQLYKIAPLDILDKYSKELVKLTPEIESNISIVPSKELDRDKEILRLYDRVSNFIIELGSIKPIIVALDDFHNLNSCFFRFLEYFLNVNKIRRAPILFTVATNDGAINLTESHNFLKKLSKTSNILDLRLSRLSLKETTEMVTNILGYINSPIDISTHIYNETEGIPGLIEESISQLYTQKQLYMDYNDTNQSYEWHFSIKDDNRFNIYNNIDEAVVNLINTFNDSKKRLLEIISIFNTSTSMDLISKIFNEGINLSVEFDELTKLKILNEKLEDWGYTYGFNSIQVRNYIYNSIDESKRLKLHKKASELMEQIYKREGRENKDELIFHLIKSNQLDKVINYCIESGENMYRLRIYSQAIDFYYRAYELISDYKDNRTLEVVIRIGQTYQNLGKNNEAIEAYKEVIKISNFIGNKERPIDARNMIGYIYLLRNDLDKAEDYFNDCIYEAKKIGYIEGLFKAAYLLIKTYINTRRIKEMNDISDIYLNLAHEYKRFDYVGIFLSQKGIAKHIKGYPMEAIKYFNDSIKYLEQGDKVQETSEPINSIGVIYLEHFQETKTARKHFEKALSIAQLYHKVEDMIRAYDNIADSYMIDAEYELAVNVLNKTISLSLEYEDELVRFIAYVKLVECYLYLEDYNKAYSSLLKAQKEAFNFQLNSIYNARFLEVSAKFYNAIGCGKRALELIDSLMENIDDLDIRTKLTLKLIKFGAQSNSDSFVDKDDLLDILDQYRKTSYVRDRRLALFYASLYFIFRGEFEESLKLQKEDSELTQVFDNDFFRIRQRFLASLTNNQDESIESLEKLLRVDLNVKCDEIRWLVYFSLGNLYLDKKEFFKSTNYFLNAINLIKGLYNNTPDEFKSDYLLSGGRPLVKEKLLYLENLLGSKNNKYNKEIDLNSYFDVSPLKLLIKNPEFYRLALNQYQKQFPMQIDSIEGLISRLTNDTHHNLELTIGFIARNILATSSHIIMKIDNKYNKVVSLGKDVELSEITHILEKIESNKKVIYLNNFEGSNNNEKIFLNRDAKALACLPVYSKDNSSESVGNDRRKDSITHNILGFLYLESDIVFNNFSRQRINSSKKLLPLISTLLDSYYLKIYSSIDKLTGVYERKYFEKIFKNQVNKSSLQHQPFSIIMCDVDHFKKVNDTYGHQRGDKILAEAGNVIKNNIRRTDIVARYGGEEFIILLPYTAKDDAFLVAEKIRKKFKEENLLGRDGQLTISCGISTFPQDSTNQVAIIEKADQALYKAKVDGRNRSIRWKDGMDFSKNRVDKLAGIITGDIVEDQRSALVLVKAIELISRQEPLEHKIYELLGRLIDILDAEEGMVIELDGNCAIKRTFSRRRLVEGWLTGLEFNSMLIKKAIDTKQGEYLIDWEDTSNIDVLTGSPNWKSIITMPVIHNGSIKALMYFTTFIKYKEFDYNSFNLVKLNSSIIGSLFV